MWRKTPANLGVATCPAGNIGRPVRVYVCECVGNEWATQAAETGRNEAVSENAEIAV